MTVFHHRKKEPKKAEPMSFLVCPDILPKPFPLHVTVSLLSLVVITPSPSAYMVRSPFGMLKYVTSIETSIPWICPNWDMAASVNGIPPSTPRILLFSNLPWASTPISPSVVDRKLFSLLKRLYSIEKLVFVYG
jgi:hypothetical protein